MANAALLSRYQRYKAGTNKLVNWLTNTARSCEDISKILPSLRAARDLVKRTKHKHKQEQASNEAKVTLTTAQLLSVTQVVVKSAVQVPEDIIRTAQAVIIGRQEHAEWFTACTSSSNSAQVEQNKTHQHFISVLKDILRLLQTSSGNPRTRKNDSVQRKPDDEALFSNSFSRLTVDEPRKDALGAAHVKRADTPKVHFEREETGKDSKFAAWCFLNDLHDLRKEVRRQWLRYRDGEISFSAVAEITANACLLAQYAENEFFDQYPDIWCYSRLLRHLGLDVVAIGYNVWIHPESEDGSADVRNGRVCGESVVDLLCPRAYIILSEFTSALALQKGTKPAKANAEYLKIHPFGEALATLLANHDINRLKELHIQQQDPLLEGSLKCASNAAFRPLIWMVIACQMHMDFHDIMSSDFSAGLNDFQSRLAADLASLRTLLAPSTFPYSAATHEKVIKDCENISSFIRRLSNDPLSDAIQPVGVGCLPNVVSSTPKYELYNILPVAAGVLISDSATQTHKFGIALCNYCRLVLSAAYLYKAALSIGAVKSHWEDMEFVIATQSNKRPFILQSDNGAGSFSKLFGIALGAQLKNYAKGRSARLPNLDHIQKHAKRMEDWPYVNGSTHYKYASDPVKAATAKCEMAIGNLERLSKTSPKDARLEDIYLHYKGNGRMTLTQMLLTMTELITEDELDVKFNYVDFRLACEDLIQYVTTSCRSVLDDMQTRRSFDDQVTHEFVFAILREAAQSSMAQTAPDHGPLQPIGEAMELWITSKGNQCSRTARNQTSGHLQAPPNFKRAKDVEKPVPGSLDEDIMLLMQHMGLSLDVAQCDEGSFLGSKALSEAQLKLHELMSKAEQDPTGSNLESAFHDSYRLAQLRREYMTEDERKDIDQRLDRFDEYVAKPLQRWYKG